MGGEKVCSQEEYLPKLLNDDLEYLNQSQNFSVIN